MDSLYRDQLSFAAMLMIDWEGRTFERGDWTYTVSLADVLSALRMTNLVFDEKEMFIRDCFDALFLRLEQVDTAVEINLTRTDHVADVSYYLRRMAPNWNVFGTYALANGYKISKIFLPLRHRAEPGAGV